VTLNVSFRLCREREARAAAIAHEIEGSTSSLQAVELENGDEEEAFSAVQRPSGDRGPGKEETGGGKTKKEVQQIKIHVR